MQTLGDVLCELAPLKAVQTSLCPIDAQTTVSSRHVGSYLHCVCCTSSTILWCCGTCTEYATSLSQFVALWQRQDQQPWQGVYFCRSSKRPLVHESVLLVTIRDSTDLKHLICRNLLASMALLDQRHPWYPQVSPKVNPMYSTLICSPSIWEVLKLMG